MNTDSQNEITSSTIHIFLLVIGMNFYNFICIRVLD